MEVLMIATIGRITLGKKVSNANESEKSPRVIVVVVAGAEPEDDESVDIV